LFLFPLLVIDKVEFIFFMSNCTLLLTIMNFTIEISLEEYLTIVLLPNSVFRNLISVTFKKFDQRSSLIPEISKVLISWSLDWSLCPFN